MAVRLSTAPGVEVQGAELIVTSGLATGARMILLSVIDDIAVFGPAPSTTLVQVQPGDSVVVDNSGFLAAQTYHRHQMPETAEYPVWDQFRNPDGSPLYPQRPLVLGPLFAAAAAGTVQSGRYEGKMIVVESLLDREALPWQADWYRSRAQEHLGDDLDDHFRLWFTDNALHGDDETQESPTHTVSYLGVLHQALRDLSRWVEEGVAPPPSTSYEVVEGQVMVPADASQRRGIQPVVSLTVDGDGRADVAVGDAITFRAGLARSLLQSRSRWRRKSTHNARSRLPRLVSTFPPCEWRHTEMEIGRARMHGYRTSPGSGWWSARSNARRGAMVRR